MKRLTSQQRALLRDVHAGDVVQGPDEYGYIWSWRINPPFKPRKVSFSMLRLRERGFVELVEMKWRLTEAGRNALTWPPRAVSS